VPILEQVLEKYPQDVKVVFKNFPLQNHKYAMKAAVAALAADSQEKFWEFHDLLFENYNRLNDEKIQEIAKTVGLNLEEYEKMKKDPSTQGRVKRDLADGRRAGVRGTPTVFINGKRLRDRSLQGFQDDINKQLEKLGKKTAKPAS
jgi:protein-disulfide isomerase